MIKCYETNNDNQIESGGVCNLIAHSGKNLKVLHITSESIVDFAVLRDQSFNIRHR